MESIKKNIGSFKTQSWSEINTELLMNFLGQQFFPTQKEIRDANHLQPAWCLFYLQLSQENNKL